MLTIDRQNYEAFFLDYLDGNLSSSQEKLLVLFLEENPDLKNELEQFDTIVMEKDDIYFPDKKGLKKDPALKDIQMTGFEQSCIAYVEGDLNHREKALFEQMLDHNEGKTKELKKFIQTKLKPDHSVVFPYKNILKKAAPLNFRLRSFYPYITLAASVLILLALYIFIPHNTEDVHQDRMADIKSDKAPTITDIKTEPIIELTSGRERKNVTAGLTLPVEYAEQTNEQNDSDIKKIFEPEIQRINKINPVSIKIELNNSKKRLARMNIPSNNVLLEINQDEDLNSDNYYTLKSYLAESLNNNLNKTSGNKDQKFELFDLVKFGVNGINRITGSNMSLKKQYTKNGDPEKIEFNSRLIAFSTPLKEK